MSRPRPESRIGLRIALPVVAVVASIVTIIVLVDSQQTRRREVEALDAYAGLLGRMILSDLHDAMMKRDRNRIQRELVAVGELEPIEAVRVLDDKGVVRFASDAPSIGRREALEAPGCAACHPGGGKALPRKTLRFNDDEGRHIFRSVEPIRATRACQQCHDEPEGAMLGLLVTDLDDDALTGQLRRGAENLAIGLVLLGVVLVGVVAGLLRWQVTTPLRDLSGVLDRLRSGDLTTVSAASAGSEIGEVTRSVQSLTQDLDGRYAVERAARRLTAVLERHPGAVMLVDSLGAVFAANAHAIARFGSDSGRLIGRQRSTMQGHDRSLYDAAEDEDTAGISDDVDNGPVVLALRDEASRLLGFLELWGEQPGQEGGQADPAPQGEAEEDPQWLLYATCLVQAISPQQARGARVLRFDARLVHARRMIGELAAVGNDAARERVDLGALAAICLWDMKRRMPMVHWHDLLEPTAHILGVRHELRAMVERLARAAGEQAGPGGHALLFVQHSRSRGTVYLSAWAGSEAEPVLVDPPGHPPLARTVTLAHGGALEVSPSFDIGLLADTRGLRLPVNTRGVLFAAELSPRGHP